MKNKVIVRLCGGLGNQMFQYASARHLSLQNDAELKMDITYFDNYFRPFEMDKLNVSATIASKDEIVKFDNGTLWKPFIPIIEAIPWIRVKDFIRKPFSYVYTEKKPSFDSMLLLQRGNIYLKGYWASYKYFENIRDDILKEFSFKNEMNDENKRLSNQILEDDNSVFLHIRRGDYLTGNGKKICCSPFEDGYYDRAVKGIAEKIINPSFFVFSDDPSWVKENIQLDFKTVYVNINSGNNSYWDMKLMSLCRHGISANSTFSWWAAWLNQNPSKIVYTPRAWMNGRYELPLDDLLPTDWIRI